MKLVEFTDFFSVEGLGLVRPRTLLQYHLCLHTVFSMGEPEAWLTIRSGSADLTTTIFLGPGGYTSAASRTSLVWDPFQVTVALSIAKHDCRGTGGKYVFPTTLRGRGGGTGASKVRAHFPYPKMQAWVLGSLMLDVYNECGGTVTPSFGPRSNGILRISAKLHSLLA